MYQKNEAGKGQKGQQVLDSLDVALADLAWWFGFAPKDLDDLTLEDVQKWLSQANRQIKARYTKTVLF